MSKAQYLQGVPHHTEWGPKKDSDDPKRHKSRCAFYIKDGKLCSLLSVRCGGSAHCDNYKLKS